MPFSTRKTLSWLAALGILGTAGAAHAVHAFHTCALFDDGRVKCWGYNANGQLGQGNTTERGSGAGQMGDSMPFVDLGTGRTAVQLSTSKRNSCAILDDGGLKCWGGNDYGIFPSSSGYLGNQAGEMGDNLPYVSLGAGRTVSDVSMGADHACVILDNGGVKCWGRNDYGQLGLGDTNNRGDSAAEMGDSLPYVDLGTGRTATAIAASHLHSCAVLDNGRLKCWGYSANGQLGLGVNEYRGNQAGEMGDNLPYVDLGTDGNGDPLLVRDVSIGWGLTCALMNSGDVKCWGANSHGKQGRGDTTERGNNPADMGNNLPVVDLGTDAQGQPHTASQVHADVNNVCVILNDGRVKCWGYNVYGNLGLGDTSARGDNANEMGDSLPYVELGTGRTAVTLARGINHSCALLDNGDVKCWGYDGNGRLGYGTNGSHRGNEPNEMGDNLATVSLGTGLTAVALSGRAAPCADPDGDGLCGDADNCPATANADQADGDADGVGDACDVCPADGTNDADGDGVCQDVDNCPTVSNGDQADNNGDGYGDACVSTSADIDPTATLGDNVLIGADAVIGSYADIGDGATINGTVGNSAVIGAGSVVPAGVTVGNAARLGSNVGLSAGCSVEVLARLGDNITAGVNCVFGSKAEVGTGSSFGDNTSVGVLAIVGEGASFADGATLGNNSQVGDDATLLAGSSVGSNASVGHTLNLGASAIIEGNAVIGDGATIGANGVVRSYVTIGNNLDMGAGAEFASGASAGDDAIIGASAEIRGSLGNGVTLNDNVFIGNQSAVGDDCTLRTNVTLGIFVDLGARCDIGADSAIYDGATLGADGAVGERVTILFRSSIGLQASIADDAIIDEQNTIGDGFTLGANSRLWPRSTYGSDVTIGANVLIRDGADISDEVTIEDDVIIFPSTTIGEQSTIRQGVELGVDTCETRVCGQVTIGGCRDVGANIAAAGSDEGACETGLVIDVDTGAREWADNTYAASCADYRNPPAPPYTYVDNVGDGIYTIDPDGPGGNPDFEVYCDMTTDGGGWTLISNRRANNLNRESCGSNIAQFFTNGCGSVDAIGAGNSYALNSTQRGSIEHYELMNLQYLNGSLDSDDAYIVEKANGFTDLFPNSTASNNIALVRVCNLTRSVCDTTSVFWKYIGDFWYHSSLCHSSSSGNATYRGNYGVCHNGASNGGNTGYSSSSFTGNRSGYNETKLWGHNNGSVPYQERLFIR